jgi:serine/threonine protein kinase
MGNFELSPGSLFANRFEIDKPAGSGGMGMVYRARDRYSGELVALKLLRAGIGGPDESERFVREAQLLSELRHPGIVSYVAHGQTADGQRFLAMEWLDGQDLGQHLAQGPLLVRDCLRLFAQVADALAVAHQRGIVHRDAYEKNTFCFLVGH